MRFLAVFQIKGQLSEQAFSKVFTNSFILILIIYNLGSLVFHEFMSLSCLKNRLRTILLKFNCTLKMDIINMLSLQLQVKAIIRKVFKWLCIQNYKN